MTTPDSVTRIPLHTSHLTVGGATVLRGPLDGDDASRKWPSQNWSWGSLVQCTGAQTRCVNGGLWPARRDVAGSPTRLNNFEHGMTAVRDGGCLEPRRNALKSIGSVQLHRASSPILQSPTLDFNLVFLLHNHGHDKRQRAASHFV